MAVTRSAVAAIATALAAVVVFGVPRTDPAGTTYAAASAVVAVAGGATGLALVGAGALMLVAGRAASLGVLAIAAGLAWWAPDVVGWEAGPAVARSVAGVAAPLYLPLVLHLVLAFPHGRLRSRLERALVAAVYAIAATISAGRALFRDPIADVHCWSNCTDNVFLLRSEPDLIVVLDKVWLVTALIAGLALAGAALGRRTHVRAVVAVVGLAEAAYAAVLLITPPEDPERAGFAAVYVARSVAAVALAAGLVWAVLQARRRLAAVGRLSAELGAAPAPGALATVLSRALGDPGLRVGYWFPAERRHVDVDGRVLALPPPGGSLATTRIARGGEPIAVVVHDADLDGTALQREIGAAARLAVDNERLQAAVLSQLAALRASRARVVERGDAERRRLERDLHDGAQQRLVALSFELRLARAAAHVPELDALLGDAVDGAGEVLEDLRVLAHGIYPAILTEAGLAPAVATLADTAPLPVELGEMTQDRQPASVESAAYLAIAAAIEDSAVREATYVTVSAVRIGDRPLVVEVADDGATGRHAPVHVADRVGALGGRLEARADALVIELPCA